MRKQKEKSVSVAASDAQIPIASWVGTKHPMRHHMNLLLSAAAGKASSNSPQISEIASGARPRNDDGAAQCRSRSISPGT
jgi:hypothetical protein